MYGIFRKAVKKSVIGVITGKGTRQKIVEERVIDKYMKMGYDVFTTLPSGKIVMKIPD